LVSRRFFPLALIGVCILSVATGVDPASADLRLSKHEAKRVSLYVAEKRYHRDAWAYKWGLYGCQRQAARRVRCRTMLRTYRGGGGLTNRECRWWTYVALRGEGLFYGVGPTRCFRL
jgi:hypothetical protein